MLELQVPLLAAKALLLLLLFAFVYAVMKRGVGDLRGIPDDETYVPGRQKAKRGGRGREKSARSSYAARPKAPKVPKAGEALADGIQGTAELVVEDSEIFALGTRFGLTADGATSIGRSSASDVVLKSDDYASGRHARLTRHGGLLYVEDLGSTNGTFVNERKAVGATRIRGGDTVRVGSTTFRYEE